MGLLCWTWEIINRWQGSAGRLRSLIFDVIFPVMAGTTEETLFLSRWLRAIYCWDDG